MIGVTGINHNTAPLEVRELLKFDDTSAVVFMKHLLEAYSVNGVVLLSTCNRTEIYYEAEEAENLPAHIVQELSVFNYIGQYLSPTLFYHHQAADCYKHLFRVISGLDSMVLGEYQIQGQVKDAFRLSNENDCSSKILGRLFHKAFETGKKIRNLYTDQSVPVSVGAAAVNFALQQGNIPNPSVLVMGAGQMADTVVYSCVKNNKINIRIYNRTPERAMKLASKYKVGVATASNLGKYIAAADMIFVATSALHPVVTAETLTGHKTPLLCFDLAVPRNISQDAAYMDGVEVFTIDHLKNTLAADTSPINQELAENIIRGMIDEYNDWLSSLNLTPVIEILQQRFDEVLNRRLEYLKTRVSDNEYKVVAQSGKYIKEKYLRNIIASFRELSENGRNIQYLEMMSRMAQYKKDKE